MTEFLARGGTVTRCAPMATRVQPSVGLRRPAPRPDAELPDLMAFAGRRWYVAALAEPGQDYAARDRLVAGGWRPWLVECRIRRRDAKTGVAVSARLPAFPGYLLLPLDLAREAWEMVEAVDGIDRLLRLAGAESPRALPGDAVARLHRLVAEADGVVLIEDGNRCRWRDPAMPQPKRAEIFAAGEKVRVIAGPFQGFEGLYVALASEDRIKILLDTLGGGRVIALPEAWVFPRGDQAD